MDAGTEELTIGLRGPRSCLTLSSFQVEAG